MRILILFWICTAALVRGAELPHGAIEDTVTSPSGVGIDLYSWGYFSPLSNWNSKGSSASGATTDPFQIVNQVTLHTPAFGKFDFEITPQIVLQPYEGERFQLLDPSIGFEGTLIEAGGFTYWARYEALVPVTSDSQEEGMLLGPQAVQGFDYRFPGSRFRAEISTTWGVKLFRGGQAQASIYFSPRLYYSFTDAFSLVSIMESSFESTRGGSLLDLAQDGDLTLGVGVKYATLSGDGLWVQPFLNFYPAGNLASNAHLAVFFGGPLL